jgi:ferredoxin-NADP reductase
MLALVPELMDRVVYICGPPGMTKTVRDALSAIGMQPTNIRTEVFRY